MWIVAAIAVPTAIAASIPLAAVDLAYHLRAGDLMLDAGAILRRDVFTSSALGAPWLNQQWGAQVVLGGLFDVGGWLALATLRAAVAATVTGLLYASCRNVGASRRSSAGLTLAAGILLAGGFLVRPQLFGILWFALTQWLLSRRDRHPNGVLWALPIAVLWANTHGSFFLAPVLFAIAWAQDLDARRGTATRTLVVGLATIPLTLLNPFGFRVWGYVVSVAHRRADQEHGGRVAPPDPGHPDRGPVPRLGGRGRLVRGRPPARRCGGPSSWGWVCSSPSGSCRSVAACGGTWRRPSSSRASARGPPNAPSERILEGA